MSHARKLATIARTGLATVDTVADLRVVNREIYPSVIETKGALAVNDQGGGAWVWDSTSMEDDDTGRVVKPLNHNGPGRFVRIQRDNFNVLWYGAVPDDTTNVRDRIQAAVDACWQAGGGEVYIPSGKYYTGNGRIQLRSNVRIRGDGMGTVLRCIQNQIFWSGEDFYMQNFPSFPYTDCGTLAYGARNINAPGHAVKAGDLIFIRSNESMVHGSNEQPRYSEVNKVIAVNGNLITLEEPLTVAFGASKFTRTVKPDINLVEGVELSHMHLQSDWTGLVPQGWYKCSAHDLFLSGIGNQPGTVQECAHGIAANCTCYSTFYNIKGLVACKAVELKVGSAHTVVRDCQFTNGYVGPFQAPFSGLNSFGLIETGEQAREIIYERITVSAPSLELVKEEAGINISGGQKRVIRDIVVRAKSLNNGIVNARVQYPDSGNDQIADVLLESDEQIQDAIMFSSTGTDIQPQNNTYERVIIQAPDVKYGIYVFDSFDNMELIECKLEGPMYSREDPPLFTNLTMLRCFLTRNQYFHSAPESIKPHGFFRDNIFRDAYPAYASSLVMPFPASTTSQVPNNEVATTTIPANSLMATDYLEFDIGGDIFNADPVIEIICTDGVLISVTPTAVTNGPWRISGRMYVRSAVRAHTTLHIDVPDYAETAVHKQSTTIDLRNDYNISIRAWCQTTGRVVYGPIFITPKFYLSDFY